MSLIAGRWTIRDVGRSPAAAWIAVGLVAVAAAIATYTSTPAVAVAAIALVLSFAVAAWRTPQLALVVVVLMPLVDRYLAREYIAPGWQGPAGLVSEVLLVIVGAAIVVRARRSGRLLPALRHPVTLIAIAFAAVAAIGTLLGHVSLAAAGLGTLFTLDAVAVFVLVLMIDVNERLAVAAAGAFIVIALVAAILELGQVLLAPDILGLAVWTGRFGEGLRPGSIFTAEPNMLAAVVGLALPFTIVATAGAATTRARILWAAGAFVLALALVYTFSRGTWVALAVAILVGTVVSRRVILVAGSIAILAVAAAFALPRGMLLPAGSEWTVDLNSALAGRLDAVSEGRDLRVKFIQNALPIVVDHPIVGTGPGTYGGAVAAHFGSPLYSSYVDGVVPVGRTVDNYWLHALVEFGVAGVVLLLALLALPVIAALRGARSATGMRRVLLAGFGCAGILMTVGSGAEMLLEGNTTSIPLWFFLGAATALTTVPAAAPLRAGLAGAAEALPTIAR